MPGRARRLPRRPSETAGALNLKEHRGRRLLTPAAAPFLKARRTAGVNVGFGTCAHELGVQGGGCAARERSAGRVWPCAGGMAMAEAGEARRTTGVNAGFEICACGLEM